MAEVKKTLAIDPEGDLLNDSDRGVDYLDHTVYSDALASLLQRAKPPLTAGIFAPWGSGKSFLLNQIKGELLKRELQIEQNTKQQRFKNDYPPIPYTAEIATQVDGNVIETFQPSDSEFNKTTKEHRKWAAKRKCAFITWSIVLSLIFALLITSLVFVFHKPASNWLVNEFIVQPSSINHTAIYTGVATRIINETENGLNIIQVLDEIDDEETEISSNFRLWLIIVLVVSSFCVFIVFCCCISSTDSMFWKHFSSNFLLILYASFTRFPRGASNVAGIIFDDDVSLKLDDSHEDSNFEGNSKLKTKYIFVNFRAWEYAGSDNLWAGIITTLSDAIEERLGSVTTRIFRLLHVEETSKYENIKTNQNNPKDDPFSIYVKLNQKAEEHDVKKIMQKYGVVTYYCKLPLKVDGFAWWYVRFSRPSEAQFTDEALTANGIFVQRYKPMDNSSYVTSEFHNVKEFRDVTDATEQYEEALYINQASTTTSCGRFCTHFRHHPKTVCCRCPYLYMWIVFVICCIIFPVLFCVFANKLELGLIQAPKIIPVEVQILSWIPATIGVLVIVVKFSWAMCNSQTTRIKRSLAGTRGNMAAELGFMNKIKNEVMIMSRMIRCFRFTHNVNYKVIITIDDLDRCPPEKVKSVFEAISILLSDRSSTFICLVAIDPRVAVKCVEENSGEAFAKARVTGHEYLKKIINLPVCLQQLTSQQKKKFMRGMIVEADETTLKAERGTHGQPYKHKQQENHKSNANQSNIQLPTKPCITTQCSKDDATDNQTNERLFSHKEFLMFCRRCFQNDDLINKCINGNPRNMKRIFNVLSFTTKLMQAMEEQINRQKMLENFAGKETSIKYNAVVFGRSEFHAKVLVRWILLTEQWPYRTSWILSEIQDEPESQSLYEVYKSKVESSVLKPQKSELISMDSNPNDFEYFLQNSKFLTVKLANSLMCFTTNLDSSLSFEIAQLKLSY